MDDIRVAIDAAKLLGRWTLIAEAHATGCSCCPGLGEVTMEQVEGSVLGWLRERHPLLGERGGITRLLKDCISRSEKSGTDVLQPIFKDLDEALSHLEQVQRGF
jgi:hypothetical protein